MFYAALDLSGTEALFAVTDENYSIIINEKKSLSGRTSSQLTPWLVKLLEINNISLKKITKWTIGSGPGGFTGLRLVASFISGLTFNANCQTRCVPSAVGIAAAIPLEKLANLKNNDKIAVLFNGYNNELLLFMLEYKDGEFSPIKNNAIVINNGSFNEENNGLIISPYSDNKTLSSESLNYLCLAKDIEAINKILPEKQQQKLTVIESIEPVSLIKNSTIIFDNNLTNLEYIRPAVYR